MLLLLFLTKLAFADDCKQYASKAEVMQIIQDGAYDKNLKTASKECKGDECICVDGKDLRDFKVEKDVLAYDDAAGAKRAEEAAAVIAEEKAEKEQKHSTLVNLQEKIKNDTASLQDLRDYLKLVYGL